MGCVRRRCATRYHLFCLFGICQGQNPREPPETERRGEKARGVASVGLRGSENRPHSISPNRRRRWSAALRARGDRAMAGGGSYCVVSGTSRARDQARVIADNCAKPSWEFVEPPASATGGPAVSALARHPASASDRFLRGHRSSGEYVALEVAVVPLRRIDVRMAELPLHVHERIAGGQPGGRRGVS